MILPPSFAFGRMRITQQVQSLGVYHCVACTK